MAICPICFDRFNRENRMPLRVPCCRNVLCMSCMIQIIDEAAKCPWDQTKWIRRTIIGKCEEITTQQTIEDLTFLSESNENDNDDDDKFGIIPSRTFPLGAGALRAKYLEMLQKRQREALRDDTEQIESDKRFALEMQNEFGLQSSSSASTIREITHHPLSLSAQTASVLESSIRSNSLPVCVPNSIQSQSQAQRAAKKKQLRAVDRRSSSLDAFVFKGSALHSKTVTDPFYTLNEENSPCPIPSARSAGLKRHSDEHVDITDKTKRKLISTGNENVSPPAQSQHSNREDMWNCPVCTFLNNELLYVCETCSYNRRIKIPNQPQITNYVAVD